eukprot:scaffold24970_cov34-Attheya_sp.AAC.3
MKGFGLHTSSYQKHGIADYISGRSCHDGRYHVYLRRNPIRHFVSILILMIPLFRGCLTG